MIAISYRREDSLAIAGRLYDRLQAKFGKKNIFMDFDSIPPGADFRQQIKQMIERSNLVIAIIGPQWLGEQPDASRRIDNPADFVRLEIAYALEGGIPVIPLLINTTQMPKPEMLPPDIQELAFRHALPLDSGMDFHSHADRLITGIHKAMAVAPRSGRRQKVAEPTASAVDTRPLRRIVIWSAAILFGVALLAFAVRYIVTHEPQSAKQVATANESNRGSVESAATDAAPPKDVGGNPEGSIMGISDVKTTETPDPDAEKNLALQIGIKEQPGATIDHNKVRIFVKFYDTVGDKDIKLTDADVNYEWLTPKHDWVDTNPEIISVRYLRLKNKSQSPEAGVGQRKYLGYIIQVYYDDKLQAVQAEPSRLLQQFPPSKSKHSTAPDSRSNFEQSEQAFRQRDFSTAMKLVDEADKADPNQPATLNLRGEILMQQGQFDDAEAAFKKAAKLDPKLRDAQYNLAQIPFKKKEYAKARDRFETLYKRIPGGDKNQAAELIKFKIYMTLLMEGKESRAHSMMEEFQFTSDTPALYYAQAAWEYKHNNPQKGEDWTNSANNIYSPALNGVFADAFYDVGWMQRPEGAAAPEVTFDKSNVGTSQAEGGPVMMQSADQQMVGASPESTPSEFAKHAMKLREQGMAQIPPLTEPTSPNGAIQRYPWKTNVVTTVFWVGEESGKGKMSHQGESAWDANWKANYGGYDNPDPSARRDYIPVAYIPKQNPFYCALPYNDVTKNHYKPEAPLVIPWFKQSYIGPGESVCRHRWVAIRKGNRTCYAQWEDCGPFRTDHFQYVFGNERPKLNAAHGAGLSVSPAVRDCLGLAPTDVIDWQFVEVRDVPPGPWRSYGENNHFVIARRQSEQRASGTEPGAANSSTTPSATPAGNVSSAKSEPE